MACPYFSPEERFPEAAWPKHPRLPLGDPYAGTCVAAPDKEWQPDQTTLRELCNLGYGRGKCPRFPAGAGPDSYRFSIVGDEGGALRVFYVAERAHCAMESGAIDYSVASGELREATGSETLREQVRAYVASYLRRKNEPEDEARHPHRR